MSIVDTLPLILGLFHVALRGDSSHLRLKDIDGGELSVSIRLRVEVLRESIEINVSDSVSERGVSWVVEEVADVGNSNQDQVALQGVSVDLDGRRYTIGRRL